MIRLLTLALTTFILAGCGSTQPTSQARHASPSPNAPASVRHIPEMLTIQSIGVDATVEPVGVDSKHKMEPPAKPHDVAWFQLGPAPGENGSSLIGGHVNFWTDAQHRSGPVVPAIFARLKELKPGAEIKIESQDGWTQRFVVVPPPKECPQRTPTYGGCAWPITETVPELNASGPPRLALYSCDGEWIGGQYNRRVVVVAVKVA